MGNAAFHAPARLRAALPWIVLGLGLAVATEPAWRIPLLGYSPELDDLLLTGRCVSSRP